MEVSPPTQTQSKGQSHQSIRSQYSKYLPVTEWLLAQEMVEDGISQMPILTLFISINTGHHITTPSLIPEGNGIMALSMQLMLVIN